MSKVKVGDKVKGYNKGAFFVKGTLLGVNWIDNVSIYTVYHDNRTFKCDKIKRVKPLFRLKYYQDNDYVMHCNTKKQAQKFCNFLDKNGRVWNNGEPYKNTHWEESKEDSCYYFNDGMRGNLDGVGDHERRILLEAKDFRFK